MAWQNTNVSLINMVYYLYFPLKQDSRMLLTSLTGTLDALGSQLVTFASDDDIIINADGIG